MSDCKVNIRIIWWHFQIKKSGKMEFGFNKAHWFFRGLIYPLAVYEFEV